MKWVWLGILGAIGIALIYLLALPDVSAVRDKNPTTTSLIELRQQQAKKAGRRPAKALLKWIPLSAISPHLVHAVLIAEDDRFYDHNGFDLEQIRVAIQRDWDKKKFAYGGSTITQQLARTLYLSPRKSLFRKAKEALITFQLERNLSKSRILELYLNVVEWGNGLYGAEAAAQSYFNCSAENLTPDQAVALASILPSPRRWSPLSERSFMARRRTQIIERMQQAGYWPEPAFTVNESSPTSSVPDLPIFDPDALTGESHPMPDPR